MELLYTLYQTTGLSMLTVHKSIMILVALCLLYLAIKKAMNRIYCYRFHSECY